MPRTILTVALSAALLLPVARASADDVFPDQPYAQPAHPRKLLVFTLTRGYRHGSIPAGIEALARLGEKTGAFTTLHSEDPAMFEPDALQQFDAVCLLNTTGELFADPGLDQLTGDQRTAAEQTQRRRQQALLDFVRRGKGLVGIHSATDTCYDWPDFGQLIGGYFNGHPWHEQVTLRVQDTDSPITQMFADPTFQIVDEIYQLRDPYSRTRQHLLLALDPAKVNWQRPGIQRTDRDFGVSWIRTEGDGRVFYCSLGHRDEIYANPLVLRHYLAGIQYALGDLPADAQPSTQWRDLFNGYDLTGWQGLAGSPPERAQLDNFARAEKQTAANERMRKHWDVTNDVIHTDGHGENLCTIEEFGDFELLVDWRIQPGGDSGIYLRGCPQVQIWDADQNPEGSGGLWNNQHQPSKPLVRADKPVGEWNTFRIRMVGDHVTVWLNDQLVVDNVQLENYWERNKPLYPRGPIELQAHQSDIEFRNIKIRELSPAELAAAKAIPQWTELFSGSDLSQWQMPENAWQIDDQGRLARQGGGYIWTQREFGDFSLELDFLLAEKTNSGVFFRTGNLNDPVQTGLELQVLDSAGKPTADKHDCGALYDCLAPTANAVNPPGQWNHLVLHCRGPLLSATLNGTPIISANLDQWTAPNLNPDGSPNKFATPLKDFPRRGRIGFQDHGNPIWYRNVRIQTWD